MLVADTDPVVVSADATPFFNLNMYAVRAFLWHFQQDEQEPAKMGTEGSIAVHRWRSIARFKVAIVKGIVILYSRRPSLRELRPNHVRLRLFGAF